MKFTAIAISALLLASTSTLAVAQPGSASALAVAQTASASASAVPQTAADYRRMEADAVRQMQAARDRDDQSMWRHKAEFYRDQAAKLESAGRAPAPKQRLTPAKPVANPVLPTVRDTEPVRAQEAPKCPPGTVTYGDSCKKPSEICQDAKGQRGLMMGGRCQIGARP